MGIMSAGTKGGYVVLGAVVTVLCIVSCVSLLVFSGIMDEADDPEYVLAEGTGSVHYRTYDESSLEKVSEFTIESDAGLLKVTLFIADSEPRGYEFVGNYNLNGISTRMYENGSNVVYIHDGEILRLDVGSEYSIIRSDVIPV